MKPLNHLMDIDKTLAFKLKTVHDKYNGYACDTSINNHMYFSLISLPMRQNILTIGWEALNEQYHKIR